MGGYVALCLALAHPERVDRIATLGTKFRWDPAIAAREAARLDPAIIRAKVPRFADALAARHEGAGGWEAVLARTADFLRELGEHPMLTDTTLSRIPHPVRVIVGDRDNTVSVDESGNVATQLASGTLAVLEDTPHPLEQVPVDILSQALQDFFGAG
jgi:pimeloyl-ACP methyl ester carboxylesterase